LLQPLHHVFFLIIRKNKKGRVNSKPGIGAKIFDENAKIFIFKKTLNAKVSPKLTPKPHTPCAKIKMQN